MSQLPFSPQVSSEKPLASEEVSEKAFPAQGLSAREFVELYAVRFEEDLDQLFKEGHQTVPASSHRPAISSALEPRANRVSISVTKARNVTGLGRILHAAQETAPVVCNKKTSEVAYVIGPSVMDEIYWQLFLSISKIIKQHQLELQARTDTARAADSRRRFFELCDSFEPIDADIPVSGGTAPSAAIEF